MAKISTLVVSLPKAKTVRGYDMKRLPLGGYLTALELIQEFPTSLLEACFPGETLSGVIAKLKQFDSTVMESIMGGALLTAPKLCIHLVSVLTQIDESELLNDPDIGLDGLIEIATAFVEVNALSNFTQAVRNLYLKARTALESHQKPTIGYKD